MKLNARIRKYLTRSNHWHSVGVFEKQGVLADNIRIYEKAYRRSQPSTFVVSYRCYKPSHENDKFGPQYWQSEFGIMDSIGNPTDLGKMMGIKTRDKRISLFSQRGRTIRDFLQRVAWIEACKLTNDMSQIETSP